MDTENTIRKRTIAEIKNDENVKKKKEDSNEKESKNEKIKTDNSNLSTRRLVRLIVLVRLLSALYNLIWDCDETYNYWEPLHFILYKHGFQTWEYASQYALRSYLYIFFHALVILPFKYLGLYKISLFYILRGIFAILSAYGESQLYSGIVKSYNSTIGTYFAFITLTSCGMFLSTTSFLPSSFVIYFICFSYSNWLKGNYKWAIFFIAFSSLIGWPFVALLGVSIFIDMVVLEKKLFKFIQYAALSGVSILSVQILVDSFMFGKFVIAPLNIIKYNVFPSGKQGPSLYGEEPLSYYLINCMLNFNVLFPIVLINPLLQLVAFKFRFTDKIDKRHFLLAISMYLWLIVFFTRPHKEERFLYPIYPLMCLSAAHSIYLISKIFKFKLLLRFLPFLIILVHAILSILRLIALFKNYNAQMYIFHELDNPKVKYIKSLESKEEINVCVGKEWYRFPSSFYLPESYQNKKWRLKFVKSNFGGQLPNEYSEKTKSIVEATRLVDLNKFNDENMEIKERYVDIKKCDFFIDTHNLSNQTIKSQFRDPNKWAIITKLNFIDINKSKSIYRAIYIPYLYEKNVKFIDFVLYKKK
jgi:alpha-1,2-mannosyltransferase